MLSEDSLNNNLIIKMMVIMLYVTLKQNIKYLKIFKTTSKQYFYFKNLQMDYLSLKEYHYRVKHQ